LTRVNLTNVLDEGLRIGEIGRRMNSKVKSVKQGVYRKYVGVEPGLLSICPSPSPPGPYIYRWSGLEDREGSDIDYNIDIRHELVFRPVLQSGLAKRASGVLN
jgi:hypothetical protein